MIPLSDAELKKLADFLNMSFVLLKLKLSIKEKHRK